jgi:hypothetical protein
VVVGGFVLVATLAACSKAPEEGAQTVDDRQQIKAQFATDDSLSAKLESGIEETNRKIEQIEATDVQLHEAFAGVLARPGEVRTEIVDDVDRRIRETALAQADGELALAAIMSEADTSLDTILRTRFAELHVSLEAGGRLTDFFFTQQDSLNRVLLSRADATPWYNTILSPKDNTGPNPTPRP